MINHDFRKAYPIFLYGGEGFDPIVNHKGGYISIYKVNNFSIISLINILKNSKKKIKQMINLLFSKKST